MKFKLGPRQINAIAAYAEQHKLVPQLSVPPTIYFKDFEGKEKKIDLLAILAFYDKWKKQKKKVAV